jgi:uncharacterized secreted protein with C-terminal beta-propeller domain
MSSMEVDSEISGQINPKASRLTDPGWAHATAISANKKKVKCNYCGKEMSRGINRLKFHIAKLSGDSKACVKVPNNVSQSMKEFLEKYAGEKRKRKTWKNEWRNFGEKNIEEIDGGRTDSITHDLVGNTSLSKSNKPTTQQLLKNCLDKDARKRVCATIARWFYHCAIPFNATDSIFFFKGM